MDSFPDTEKKIKSMISRYNSALKKEYEKFGYYRDGTGKRYVMFWLYFALNDLEKAEKYIEWYEKEFSDDIGEPIQKLCWSLLLYRMVKEEEATYRLADTMLFNLYLIPYVIGEDVKPYQIWHSINYSEIGYLEEIPEELLEKITDDEKRWMERVYHSKKIREIRNRYIEIYHEIETVDKFEERKKLLNEARGLLNRLL
jgi:hypothetical protein